ncbi:MAG: hypothetical protein WCX82_02400 [archaeon]|jgi:hypothetical protein
MPLAPKSKMIQTKTGRLINSNFVGKQKPNGVVSLEKSKGTAKQKTNRQIKEELKTYDQEKIISLIEESKKRYSEKLSILKIKHLLSDSRKLKNPAQFLLSKGIDARQLKAKGIPIYVIMDIFGLKETVKLFKIDEKKSGRDKFHDRELESIIDYYGEKIGGSERYTEKDLIKYMIKEYGIKDMLDVFGLDWVVHGAGVSPVMKMYNIKELAKVANFRQFVAEIGLEPTIEAAGGLKAAAQLFKNDRILDAFLKYSYVISEAPRDYEMKDCPYIITEFADAFGVKNTLDYWGLKATTRKFGLDKIAQAFGGWEKLEKMYESEHNSLSGGRPYIFKVVGLREFTRAHGGILKTQDIIIRVGGAGYRDTVVGNLGYLKEYSLKEIVDELGPRYTLKCYMFSELEEAYGFKEVDKVLGRYLNISESQRKSKIISENLGNSTKDITKEISANKKK